MRKRQEIQTLLWHELGRALNKVTRALPSPAICASVLCRNSLSL